MFAWLPFSAFTSGGRYKTFRTLKGHLKGVMTVDMSSNGDLLASGGTCLMCLLLTMASFRRRGRREGVGSASNSLSTPAYRHSMGPTSKLLWITATGSDHCNLCFGTGLGYFCIWTQNSQHVSNDAHSN